MEGLLEEFSDPQEQEDKPAPPPRSSAGPIPNGSPESQQPKVKNLGNLRAITDDELREIGVPMPN